MAGAEKHLSLFRQFPITERDEVSGYRICRRCERDIGMLTELSTGVRDDAKMMDQEV
jgi:hypothetical protein